MTSNSISEDKKKELKHIASKSRGTKYAMRFIDEVDKIKDRIQQLRYYHKSTINNNVIMTR